MSAYPVLLLDQTTLPAAQQPERWTSAMTYKFVGALRSLTDDKPYQRTAIWVGVAIGFATELLRKIIKSRDGVQELRQGEQGGIQHRLPAGCGGAAIALRDRRSAGSSTCRPPHGSPPAACSRALVNSMPRDRKKAPALPEDMSTTSLVGGGLIAGDALAALGLGIAGLLATVFAT